MLILKKKFNVVLNPWEKKIKNYLNLTLKFLFITDRMPKKAVMKSLKNKMEKN